MIFGSSVVIQRGGRIVGFGSMVEAQSLDEARGIVGRLAARAYRTSDGWQPPHILVWDGSRVITAETGPEELRGAE